MLIPTHRLLWGLLPSALLALWPGVADGLLGLSLALWLLVALWDAWRCWNLADPQWQRDIPQPWYQGQQQQFEVHLRLSQRVYLQWMEQLPSAFQGDEPNWQGRLEAGEQRLRYPLIANQRGRYQISGVRWRMSAHAKLWWKSGFDERVQECSIWPTRQTQQTGHQLPVKSAQLSQRQRLRRYSQSGEFIQLREFQYGDNPRGIDWKASARQRQLISREYQPDPEQDVIFILDAASGLWAEDAEGPYFDRVIEALLGLFIEARPQQRGVGLMVLQGQKLRYLPPTRSQAQFARLLDAVHDLQPVEGVSDYQVIAQQIRHWHVRRAELVIICQLSDLRSEALVRLKQQLPAGLALRVLSLREAHLEQERKNPLFDFDDALAYLAVSDYLQQQQVQITHLQHRGVPAQLLALSQLSSRILQQYHRL